MAVGWGGGGTQKGRQSAEEYESSHREIPMESLQMDRLGQIIVICFLRTTDAGGWRGETRIKEEGEKKGEEHILPASEAAENRLQQGEKNKSAKNTTSSSISHPPSLHPSYQDAHTHTHHLFLSAYISLSTQASWTQEVQEWEESGSWGHSRVSNRRWGGLDMDAWDCVCVRVRVCLYVICGSISPTILRIHSLYLHSLLLSALHRCTLPCSGYPTTLTQAHLQTDIYMHNFTGGHRAASIYNQVWGYTGAGENHSYQAAFEWENVCGETDSIKIF